MPKNIFTGEIEHLFHILDGGEDRLRLVGGCVRDSIIGRGIVDYDLATKHRPEELIAILDRHGIEHLDLARRFGTVTAILNGKKFEITTLRRDVDSDGRHVVVEFSSDYGEDAGRRDFTFNALYCDSNLVVHDYFGGITDLKKGLIRFIGNPEERIVEDHLRILRFFRFYAGYCYSIDHRALEACRGQRDSIDKLSRERVTGEMRRILETKYPVKVLRIMERCGILQKLLHYENELDLHGLEIFYSLKNHLDFRCDYLFVLAAIASKNKIEHNLKLRKSEKIYLDSILDNIPQHMDHFEIEKLLFRLGNLNVVKAIIMIYLCNNFDRNYGEYLDFLERTRIPKLEITAKDLAEHGFEDKREYSRLIEQAKDIFTESGFIYGKKEIMEALIDSQKKYYPRKL
ncbi:MAG: CCA tRNA nucleotidyltransferase [Rickettsiales bacterium]|nr:CCA tRNA nucleotidyltransferase [Rickettsiales bacterium]